MPLPTPTDHRQLPAERRPSPAESIAEAQVELLRREAAWRRQRAEVARLIAAGEEEAAARLREQIGDPPTAPVAPTPSPVAPTPETPSPALTVAPTPAPREEFSKPARRATQPAATPRIRRTVRRRRRRRAATWGAWLKSRPPWVVSTVTHGLLLAVLAMATFVSFADPPVFLNVALDEGEWAEEIPQVTLTAAPAELDPATPADAETLDTVDLTALLEPAPIEAPIETRPLDGVPASLGALMAEVGAPEADGAEVESAGGGATAAVSLAASEPTGKVRFFGAESVADRVVFVVDNSGSMQYGRLETTLVELQRAVKRLSHSQSFYVVFFSDQAYPMFFPEPVHELQPATRENKQRLSKWLTSVEMCLGGRLLDAVELAASLEPQVVYLLSDGDIRSQRVMGALTDPEAWDFPIHTLAMGARDKDDAGKMAAIAEANGGGYQFVRAKPQSLLRAKRKPIRYNREPGPVWGSQVRSWGR